MLKPNQKYTLLAKATDGLYPSVMTGGYEFPLTSSGTSFKNGVATITTNNLVNGSKGQILYINLNGGATYKQELRDVMIFEGDLSIIPDSYFEGLKSFGEAEKVEDKYKISILSHNKNLLNTNEFTNNKFLSYEDGTIQEAREGRCITEKFYELPQNIVLSSTENLWKGFWIYDVNFKFIRNVESQNDVLVTKQSNEKYYRIGIQELRESILSKKVQLEEGTIKTEYKPYKCDKKDILISAPLPGFDFGADIMYEDNGQVKITRNIDTYTFTGDETMRDTTEQDEKSGTGKYKVFALTVNKTIDINKNINNNFPKEQFNVAFQNMDSEGLAVTQYGVYIKILKSKLSTQDTEGFKAWLKANQTVIYFVRATPVTEIVENCVDIDLDTYQEKTYFNILNSLPGTLDFKVPSNIGSVVQNMAKEVNNIWDVINNLLVPSIVKANGNLAMLKLNNNLN